MRTFSGYILLMAVAAGCAVNRADGYDPAVVLAFQPAVLSMGEDAGTVPDSRPFGGTVWTLPADKAWEEHSEDAEELVSSGNISVAENGLWYFSDRSPWPDREHGVTVIAWHPYEEADACDRTDGVVFGDVDVSEDQTDLLYTVPQTDLNKMVCGGVIPLPFCHALCRVDFTVNNKVAADERIVIRRIAVDAAGYKGDFRSLPSPQWTMTDDRREFVFFEGEQDTRHRQTAIGRSLLMMPQKLSAKVNVAYDFFRSTGTEWLRQSLDTEAVLETRLEPGRHYTYALSVGIDEVDFQLEIIEERLKK